MLCSDLDLVCRVKSASTWINSDSDFDNCYLRGQLTYECFFVFFGLFAALVPMQVPQFIEVGPREEPTGWHPLLAGVKWVRGWRGDCGVLRGCRG
jgi:hypothetical protein